MEISKNQNLFLESFLDGLRPEKTYTVSEWSNKFRYLAPNASAEPGRYRTSRTPFLEEIMDCLTSNNEVEKVALMKAAQIGGSELLNNFVGYVIDVSPGSIMVVQPTVDTAKKFSKQRIDTMIEYSPTLKEKVASKRDRDSSNTVLSKDFKGGMLNIVGANSAVGLRSTPVRFLCMDEVDAYPPDIDGEGDPIKLAEKRTTTFSRRKIFLLSTPTIENLSTIDNEFKKGDQRYYNVPCPHCKGKQKLIFSNLKFLKKNDNEKVCDPESVYYECIFCQNKIFEYSKTWMLDNGEWIPENTSASKKIRSYHINSLYSPLGWKSWPELIDEFLESQTDPFKLKTFINTVLGETYKEKTQQPDWVKLYNRKENYHYFEAPKEVVYCCAGADTQENRIAICVLGFGADNEIWVLAYDEILGSPTDPLTWQQVRRYVDTPIKHATGAPMFISDVAIDSAGSNTDDVYDFCKKNSDKFIPIIGRGDIGFYMKESKTIDVDRFGKKYDNPLKLYQINTILAKKTIYNFLQNENPGARYIHFSDDLQKPFFEMLTSEQLITKIIKGKSKEEFIKPSASTRNESLDCFGYAYSLAYSKGVGNLYGEEYEKVYKAVIGKHIKQIEIKEEEKEELSPFEQNLVQREKSKKKINSLNKNGLSFNRR